MSEVDSSLMLQGFNMINTIFNVFNLSGELINSYHRNFADSNMSPEARIKELIFAEGFMSMGDVVMVEIIERGGDHSNPRRKWFNAEMRGAPDRIHFCKVDGHGVKTKVNLKGLVEEKKNVTLYFSTNGMPAIGIVFYDSSSAKPFFGKFDKFSLNGHTYFKVVEPQNNELILTKIMG